MNDLKIWNSQRTKQIDTNRLHRSKCSIFLGTRMFHKDKHHMGGFKIPKPFQKVFSRRYRFFPRIVFPSAGITPWSKNSHEREQGKGKGLVNEGNGKNRKGRGKGKEKGKGEERESKRKNKQCISLTRTIFDAKSYRFRYRFVIVREPCVCVFLFLLAIIEKGV